MIKRIKITNFKSFNDLEIELGNFNVLIGANASGKSNFIQLIRFLKDISMYDLKNAIQMQGGVEYLRNIKISTTKNLTVKITFDKKSEFPLLRMEKKNGRKKRRMVVQTYECIYEFELEFEKKGSGCKIVKDNINLKCDLFGLEKKGDKLKKTKKLGSGDMSITTSDGVPKFTVKFPKNLNIEKNDFIPSVLYDKETLRDELLIEGFFFPYYQINNLFDDVSIYDFNPKLPKKAVSITGKRELEEDGSNLAIVLKNIKEDDELERKFSNLIKELLPFLKDLDVEKFMDSSLIFKSQETYSNHYLPSSLMSDGTINITSLIIALYFEDKSLIVIEEPEKNIHPYLISKVVNMLKEASNEKQIIITTHNPEIVKYTDLENILLITRDKKGFSNICRPAGKEEVKKFLENEIGIEDLYIQDLLGI